MAPNKPTLTLDQDPATIHVGDTLTFHYTADGIAEPAIYVRCYQGEVLVYASGGWPIGFYHFTLESDAWKAAGNGPAEGRATLVSINPHHVQQDKVLVEVDFPVQA